MKRTKQPILLAGCAVTILSVALVSAYTKPIKSPDVVAAPGERHLRNVTQLTFGGENAEAYFSADGRRLIFQSTRDERGCDQIYTMNVDGSNVKMVSTGTGRTTCSYFFPNLGRILYSSTHLGSKDCPPRPDFSQGYVWAIYPSYDIFRSEEHRLISSHGYISYAVFCLKK